MAVYVKEHELATSPAWDPGKGAIPLSVDQAVDAIITSIKKRNPNHEEVIFSELVLKQVRSGDNKLYWHYLVRYRETLEDGSLSPKESISAVFLDGEVAPVVTLLSPM